jgi:hypothetical protein
VPCSMCTFILDFAVSVFGDSICKWCYHLYISCEIHFDLFFSFHLKNGSVDSCSEIWYMLKICQSPWHFYVKIMWFLITYWSLLQKSKFFLFSLTIHMLLFCFSGTVYLKLCCVILWACYEYVALAQFQYIVTECIMWCWIIQCRHKTLFKTASAD